MNEFAGLEIDKIDIKSMESLDVARVAFMNNYYDNYFIPHDCADDQSVISPLRSYIKWILVPTRTLDQTMAMIIKYLPDDEDKSGTLDDHLTLLALKLNLRLKGCGGDSGYAFREIDFNQRCEMVQKFKRKICFHDDWDYAVTATYKSLHNKLFAMAGESLQKIAGMSDTSNKSISKKDLPAIISLQISYYITIINYLRDKLYNNFIKAFYSKVEQQLIASINNLKKLPEYSPEEAARRSLTDFFFFYKNGDRARQYKQIEPELKQPWISSSERKFKRF